MVTVSGGAGVLVSDAAEALGLPMPPMPDAAQARLLALLPFAAPHNPVDCTAQALNDFSLVGRFTERHGGGGRLPLRARLLQPDRRRRLHRAALRTELAGVRARHPDRLYVLSVLAAPDLVDGYEADGWTVFEDPTRAVNAIAAMGRLGDAFAAAPAAPPPRSRPWRCRTARPDEAGGQAPAGRRRHRQRPGTRLRRCGRGRGGGRRDRLPRGAEDPVAGHHPQIGDRRRAARRGGRGRRCAPAFATLMARAADHAPGARLAGVLVAKQLRGGVECILGIHRDPVFGPVAMVGLGGIFVEVLRTWRSAAARSAPTWRRR